MNLPGMLVEYLINGSSALAWIWIILSMRGVSLPGNFNIIVNNGALFVLFVPIIYVIGMFIDFIAVYSMKPIKVILVKLFGGYISKRKNIPIDFVKKITSEYVGEVEANIWSRSADLGRELQMRSSRDRIARGACINIMIITIVLSLYYSENNINLIKIVIPMGIFIFLVSVFMWIRYEFSTSIYAYRANKVINKIPVKDK